MQQQQQQQPVNGSKAVWSSSVETAMKDLKSLGWVTQRVIFIISGTTKNADHVIFETPSVLLGLVIYKSLPTPQSSSSSPHVNPTTIIIWKALEDIPMNSGHLGSPFRGRRNHTAIYFDALADVPARQMIEHELKRYGMKLKKQQESMSAEKGQSTTTLPTSSSHDGGDEEMEIQDLNDSIRFSTYKQLGKTPTCVPCILVVGGFEECPKRQLREDLWVLKLSKLLPRFLRSENRQNIIEKRLLMGLLLSGMKCTPTIKQLLQVEDQDEEDGTLMGHGSKGFSIDELRIMKSVWSDPSKNYQPALYQVGTAASTGLIWSLATMIRHPFSPISYLVENASERHVHARTISVCFEKWYGHVAISITDDGNGLTHKGLHLLLKRFGHMSDDLSNKHPDQFGLGFKLAVGRLAHNAIVITKTTWTYGVGLFSSPLNALMSTVNFACPIACWSTTDGFPVVLPTEESTFAQTVGMILKNSPLGISANLENEFLSFGKSTGRSR